MKLSFIVKFFGILQNPIHPKLVKKMNSQLNKKWSSQPDSSPNPHFAQQLTQQKKILITLGDPLGIGPEIVVKFLVTLPSSLPYQIEVVGEKWLLQETVKALGLLEEWSWVENHLHIQWTSLDIFPKKFQFMSPGPSKEGGKAAFCYFDYALNQCMDQNAHAIVTAPLCKESIHAAGYHFMGHTEIIEKKIGQEVVMTLIHPKMVVGHVTDHKPLREALDSITPDRLRFVITQIHTFLSRGCSKAPKIALCGVNPHAGENGILGREELEILQPLMKQMVSEGYHLIGPLPADTIFIKGLQGAYDAIIAMYHDQGFGPMKTIDFAHGVNATLGAPFIRTSPDHGTAFDIVGKDLADPTSFAEAFRCAVRWMLGDS